MTSGMACIDIEAQEHTYCVPTVGLCGPIINKDVNGPSFDSPSTKVHSCNNPGIDKMTSKSTTIWQGTLVGRMLMR